MKKQTNRQAVRLIHPWSLRTNKSQRIFFAGRLQKIRRKKRVKVFASDDVVSPGSLQSQSAEHTLVIGPTGAGKSTLLAACLAEAQNERGTAHDIRVFSKPDKSNTKWRWILSVVFTFVVGFGSYVCLPLMRDFAADIGRTAEEIRIILACIFSFLFGGIFFLSSGGSDDA